MHELDLDQDALVSGTKRADAQGYVLIEIDAQDAARLPPLLAMPVRRCYVSDDELFRATAENGGEAGELVDAKLPPPGSVRSGDFGEILTALLQGSFERPDAALEPKKWRLKQDNTRPAPYTDVVQLVLPEWPQASPQDRVLCSEVKTKATGTSWRPVSAVLADAERHSDGRLLNTLLWLRKRALFLPDHSLGTVDAEQLQRFIRAAEHPPATHSFRAVVVISSDLVDDEIASLDAIGSDDQTVVFISVADLKATYEATFAAARATVAPEPSE